jgi:hypothetical protein
MIETLSLVSEATRPTLIIGWSLPILVFSLDLIGIRHRGQRLVLPKVAFPKGWFERGLLSALAFILIVTAVTAWLAPPNTYDSLTYHMSRVAHWAQEESVHPFATGIQRQLYMSPGAEFGIFHLYVLGQTDRMVNFVEWSAMLVSLVAISLLARDLGADQRGQLLGGLFAATLPMGIAQASSTMTDYVTAMWLILAVLEALRLVKGAGGWIAVLSTSAATGLALLTKPTALPFILPFVIWAVLAMPSKYPLLKLTRYAFVGIIVILVLNSGHFIRNWTVFGSLLGGGSNVSTFINSEMNPRLFLSNVLRNMSLHVGTPWKMINDQLYTLLAKLHWKLGVDLTDRRTSVHPFFTIWPYPSGETRAPNTPQAILLLVSMTLMIARRKLFSRMLFAYGLAVATGFLLLSGIFKFTILGSRYHMPFFILAAPLAGHVLSRTIKQIPLSLISSAMLIASLPLLFNLKNRSLLPDSEYSLLSKRRLDLYFLEAPQLDEPYYEMTQMIEAASCDRIGLILQGDTPEYLIWVFLDAPNPNVTLDWIISRGDTSGQYRKTNFNSCAVICEGCENADDAYNGLPLMYRKRGYRLFLKQEK